MQPLDHQVVQKAPTAQPAKLTQCMNIQNPCLPEERAPECVGLACVDFDVRRFQTNGSGKAELCSLWECLCLWATARWPRGEGGSRINLSAPPAMPLEPPASQFDKYQKSTRNENASNFLRCQSSFVSSMQFSPSLPLVPVEGFWHVGSSSTVIDWHWLAHIGSSHVMLLTATPHMPLGRSPYIGTGRQLKLRFVCRTQRQPRTKDCLLPLIYSKWGRTEFNFLDHESWAKQLRMLGNFREAKLSPQTILVPVGWAAEYSGGGEHTPLEDGLSGLPPLQSIDDPVVWLPVAHLCVAVCSCV